ncbi:MAG: hypothetical protein A2X86_21635 [Bdellovibrionales bacterium GWA2_49_15]|nr:MAG: hypothetical protein A2X86_21635 [Bdellovibrionales bacterium GWA2_49_15]HAZ11569.1 hypothetical protein [Bdellovibrionales bacterium]
MKIVIFSIVLGLFVAPLLGASNGLPDIFSFKSVNSGRQVNGEPFVDHFTVTGLGQIFWENSSNTSGACPHLAGILKGQLTDKELGDFAALAKEALLELEGNNKNLKSEQNERSSHEWKLVYGDLVYNQPIAGGQEKVQKLQDLIVKLKNRLDASSVVILKASEKKNGQYDLKFELKGKLPLALVFTAKVGDTFGPQYHDWKYQQAPPATVILNQERPTFQVTVMAPKKPSELKGFRATNFTYSNFSLADHYEGQELGDEAGYRPIKVCAQL